MADKKLRGTFLLLFLLLFGVYAFRHYWPTDAGQNTRLDLLYELTYKHTFRIDSKYMNTADYALYHGHYYSEKAPGVSLIGFPAYLLSSRLVRAFGIPVANGTGWELCAWATTAGSVAVITAFSACAFYALMRHLLGQHLHAMFATLVFYLGSTPTFFAVRFNSASLLFAYVVFALWAMIVPVKKNGKNALLQKEIVRDCVAGCSLGFALASEYSAGIAVVLLLVFGFVALGWKRGVRICLFAALPALTIPLYSWFAFHSPFAISYRYSVHYAVDHSGGFFGITFVPSMKNIVILLFSRKSIFVWTPYLLLAVVGCKDVFSANKSLFWCCLIIPLVQFFVLVGYQAPLDLAGLNERFLACVVALLAIPAAFGARRFPRTGFVLGILSILFTSVAIGIDANTTLPLGKLVAFYTHQLFIGKFVPMTLLSPFGVPPWISFTLPIIAALVGSWYLLQEPAKRKT